MPLLKTATLGCKVNQYETELVREGLVRLGYCDAPEGEPADLCIVNTCTVTADGDAKSRKLIRYLARTNPQAEIVVMGCYATRAPAEVASLPGVVEVIAHKRQIPDWLAARGLTHAPAGISTFARRHRAFVKVQDGCRLRCSYCIIPTVRFELSSRPPDEVTAEVERLVDGGFREIVLVGIHLGHYGNGTNLAQLVGQLTKIDRDFRIRLSSLEAVEVTPELLGVMEENPVRVCGHLHIAMQSGSDAVLRRMQRRLPAAEFIRRCHAAVAALGRPALTTDVIVGFPGETEADFQATCRAAEAVRFAQIHVFRYSPRAGTPAAELSDPVPPEVQQDRAARLIELGARLRQEYFDSLHGQTMQILVESPVPDRPGIMFGHSEGYAPVELAFPAERHGELVMAVAGAVTAGRLQATVATTTVTG